MSKATICRRRLAELINEEEDKYVELHPKSKALFERAKSSLLAGVPMHWMVRSAGRFPLFVKEGKGSHFTDVDGHKFLDLCLGDTGSMTGHAPDVAVKAISERVSKGITFMLPTEDSIWVAEELQRRFGMKYWQFCLTATDANRFVIRIARHLTKRKKILVFNYCYHGTVDETFLTLENGVPTPRAGNIGAPVDPNMTTRVVEFNDLPALEAALAQGDVAAVLAEPAMTNIGIILPEPGYHQALRELTRRYGTMLIIDETHTISTGIGGYTKEYNLQPDLFVLGKPIASGVPAAIYGFSEEVGQRLREAMANDDLADTGGIGGTLSGNALSLAAMRATLQHVLTPQAYEHTIALAVRFQAGVEGVIREFNLPWIVQRLGCRVEYWFRESVPRNGGEAAAACDNDLDRYMHTSALNRGILLTPFHNMALISPATTEADIDYHTKVFRDCVAALFSKKTPARL